MNDQIRQIAQRLAGLREAVEAEAADVAACCGVAEADYLAMERAERDIPVSVLYNISQRYGVELSSLMFGDDPHMNAYFLTRNGKGPAVERVKAYQYESLAVGFSRRKGDPFMVTVQPTAEDTPIHLNAHPGQEFNYVIEGTLRLQIGNNTMELNEGDSIYFDSNRPHGMKAMNGKAVKFLAIIM